MNINLYDSMFGLMKDVTNGLWDGGLCLLQGYCVFVVNATTRLVIESLYI